MYKKYYYGLATLSLFSAAFLHAGLSYFCPGRDTPAGSEYVFLERPDQDDHLSVNPQVLKIVAQSNNRRNFLIRSSNPVRDGTFQYDELKHQFGNLLQDKGFDPDKPFTLLCYTFLNSIQNRKDLLVEKQFFEENPNLGELKKHTLYGSLLDPCKESKLERDAWLASDLFEVFDKLSELMKSANRNLTRNTTEPRILLFHCRAGKDRTGEACACYQMEFEGYSYERAMQTAEEVAGRPLRDLSVNAIKWYAFYLRDRLGGSFSSSIGLIEGH